MKKKSSPFMTIIFLLIFFGVFCSGISCSFDYGSSGDGDEDQADVVMREVEYVRVRDGDPVVRFQAEQAERYEKRQTMELKNFSFEQFEKSGEEINAQGRAGTASVELESGNINLNNGVHIEIDSEDIIIETRNLSWFDKEKELLGGENAEVKILRNDGTNFSGKGFSANARSRTWEFSSGVEGSYTHEDEEEDAEIEEEIEGEDTDTEISL
ncbi:hypothetical protein AGMMS49928_12300 [Spirochaetia bacterium]|nr:hypothetical protein AGMMS49928_12300 [Spirochaetia bacterium]